MAPVTVQQIFQLREVQDLAEEFLRVAEVTTFVSTVALLLALATRLRSQLTSDAEFQQSVTGAHTPGTLMSVQHPLKKQKVEVVAHLKGVLD